MLLNELTWPTTCTYLDVIDGITTDPVPPAYIIPGDGLSKPENPSVSVQGNGNDKRTCSARPPCPPTNQYPQQS